MDNSVGNSVEMENLKKNLGILRNDFTRYATFCRENLLEENLDLENLLNIHIGLKGKFVKLCAYQEKISKIVLNSVNDEKWFEEDLRDAQNYRNKFIELNAVIKNKLKHSSPLCFCNETDVQNFLSLKFKLKKFSGDAKDYISFWSQFERIHLDDTLSDKSKFIILLQSIVPQSKAATVVGKYPVTSENYPKVVKELKANFGQEDTLVQMYVREMFAMAMKNVESRNVKKDLTALYSELEAKILTLNSLGRTQEKYENFLIPLVEVCLPNHVLDAWKNHRNKFASNHVKNVKSVENIMNFLKQIAMNEEIITLVRKVFGVCLNESIEENFQDVMSATSLVEASCETKVVSQNPNEENPDNRLQCCIASFKVVPLNRIKAWSEYAESVIFHGFTPVCTKNPRLNEKVSIFLGDITTLFVDAIVNTEEVGVNGAIHKDPGPIFFAECETLNDCEPVDAKITHRYGQGRCSKYVIHAAGITDENVTKLADCYKKCLVVALKNKVRSIAFPCISTRREDDCNKKAAQVKAAIKTVREFLEQHESFFDRVIFCSISSVDVVIYGVSMQEYFPA